MKLLICTQSIDRTHQVLGFFHRWILEFAQHCERVTVICLERGSYSFPSNVEVISLGKEESEKSRLKYALRFYAAIWRKRNDYDSVLVHMNPEYVCLGGILWHLLGKKIAIWYTHKSVTLKLRLAEFLSQAVFTASGESFRIKSSKISVIGHGIDTRFWVPKERRKRDGILRMITVGRISRVKDYGTLIRAAIELKTLSVPFIVTIVGGPATEIDCVYEKEIKNEISRVGLKDYFYFAGVLSQEQILPILQDSDVFFHTSRTGSMDKAALEAMASGVILLSSSDAFRNILEPFSLYFEEGKGDLLAAKVLSLSAQNLENISINLRSIVVENHDIRHCASTIVSAFGNINPERVTQVIRYILSGGIAAFVNILLLYVLTEFGRIYYMFSAVISFVAAFLVSYGLQKYWTFEDNESKQIARQMTLYFFVTALAMIFNASLLYFLVEFFRVWYILAEILVAGLIAVITFVIYKNFIFCKTMSRDIGAGDIHG